MLILVKLLGIVIVVMGVIFLISPTAFKQYAAFWRQRKKLLRGYFKPFIWCYSFVGCFRVQAGRGHYCIWDLGYHKRHTSFYTWSEKVKCLS